MAGIASFLENWYHLLMKERGFILLCQYTRTNRNAGPHPNYETEVQAKISMIQGLRSLPPSGDRLIDLRRVFLHVRFNVTLMVPWLARSMLA